MAYCSLAMNVGCFNDPPERQGLAHFLEHMIFMGSTKYPEEDAYGSHMAKSGGYCNAYTEFEWTNFQFQCTYSGLKDSLDMAANNFASPLLKKEDMDREINAVESEFKMNLPDDNVRILQILMNNTFHDDHLFNRFMWGNLQSLKGENPDTLWDDLKKFYDEHYSADRMKVCIQVKSHDNLQELRGWVEETLSIIPNKNLGVQDFSQFTKNG